MLKFWKYIFLLHAPTNKKGSQQPVSLILQFQIRLLQYMNEVAVEWKQFQPY